MSVLVVATHTGLFSLIHDKELADTLINSLAIKVPFFFVASGFLVWYKIGNSSIEDKKTKLRRWINKTFRLYIVWTILYLPFTIYGFYHDGIPVLKSLVVFTRNVLFVGQNFLSWPLWYLLWYACRWSCDILNCCSMENENDGFVCRCDPFCSKWSPVRLL